jgi:hypothetical protein
MPHIPLSQPAHRGAMIADGTLTEGESHVLNPDSPVRTGVARECPIGVRTPPKAHVMTRIEGASGSAEHRDLPGISSL